MKLFDGKKVAQKILKELARDIKSAKITPKLAIIFVGNDEASRLYVKLKKDTAQKVGINIEEYNFSTQASHEKIIAQIEKLNQDEKVHGIIVQLPLPATMNADDIISAIDPKKDVDGFHKENQKLLEKGKPCPIPVLPMAILVAIKQALKKKMVGKKALALVNSETFGRVLKIILEKEGIKTEFLERNTCLIFGAEKRLKETDILISVCGCPKMIKGDMIKEDAVLIDVGITRYHDGKVVGDVDRKSVESKAAFLTPTPGGIGPVTVALLLRNVFLASRLARRKDS